jgi:hypothetical protein
VLMLSMKEKNDRRAESRKLSREKMWAEFRE